MHELPNTYNGQLRHFSGKTPTASSGSLSPVLLQNTVWIAKNGVDADGQRNNLSKPFITFSAAIAAAVAGDVVIVMPGTYSEGLTISKSLNFHFFDGAVLSGFVNVAANMTWRNAYIDCNVIDGWCFQMSAANVVLNLHNCKLESAKDGIKRQLGASNWRVNLYNCLIDSVDDCLQFPNGGGDDGFIYAQDCRFKSQYQPAEMGDFRFEFRNCIFDNTLATFVPRMGPIDCIPTASDAGVVMGIVDSCKFVCQATAPVTINYDNDPYTVVRGAIYLFSNCQSNKPWTANADFAFNNCWENPNIA